MTPSHTSVCIIPIMSCVSLLMATCFEVPTSSHIPTNIDSDMCCIPVSLTNSSQSMCCILVWATIIKHNLWVGERKEETLVLGNTRLLNFPMLFRVLKPIKSHILRITSNTNLDNLNLPSPSPSTNVRIWFIYSSLDYLILIFIDFPTPGPTVTKFPQVSFSRD